MNPHFHDTLDALRRAGEHMQAAHAALVAGIEAALAANGEHLDLRETVERLQATVLQQTTEIRGLRDAVQAQGRTIVALREQLDGFGRRE